jgi:hypothetical protein
MPAAARSGHLLDPTTTVVTLLHFRLSVGVCRRERPKVKPYACRPQRDSELYHGWTLRPDNERTECLRPDSRRGVFETLLVVGGEPIELEAHMARLASSIIDLSRREPPRQARELVREHASGRELGRLRLDVAPDAQGELAPSVRVADVDRALVFPAWERAATLAAVVVPGGIGAHKWSDRRLLDGAQSELGEALPLVLDANGDVFEVARGNVFVVRGGSLLTPPLDGRLLPGVARARILEVAAAVGIPVRERVVRRRPRRGRRGVRERLRARRGTGAGVRRCPAVGTGHRDSGDLGGAPAAVAR